MTPADVLRYRDEIPALHKSIYLNTGGYGPIPRSVTRAVTEHYEAIMEHGADTPAIRERTATSYEHCRQTVADLFGVESDEIALTRAVSEGLSAIAYGMDFREGDEVIVTEQEHPSGIYVWLNLAKKLGIRIKKLPLFENNEQLLDCLNGLITGRTKLLAPSHVTTDTGQLLPAEEICSLAHERGVPVAFDGVQAAGQFPMNLREIGADFYSWGANKWCLGGPGVAALYVKKEWVDRLEVSWTGSLAGEWDRETDELTFHESARRFEFGGRPYPVYSGMAKGIEFVTSFGLDDARRRAQDMTGQLKAAIAEIPGVSLRSPEDPSVSTGLVTFSVAGLTGDELNRRMWERWRILGRPALGKTAMRVSVAFFTTEDEIETVVDALATLSQSAGP